MCRVVDVRVINQTVSVMFMVFVVCLVCLVDASVREVELYSIGQLTQPSYWMITQPEVISYCCT